MVFKIQKAESGKLGRQGTGRTMGQKHAQTG